MALVAFHDFCKDNAYGLTAQRFRYLLKQDPSAEKCLRRISTRGIFVDEEAVEEWVASKKYFAVKRKKSAK